MTLNASTSQPVCRIILNNDEYTLKTKIILKFNKNYWNLVHCTYVRYIVDLRLHYLNYRQSSLLNLINIMDTLHMYVCTCSVRMLVDIVFHQIYFTTMVLHM